MLVTGGAGFVGSHVVDALLSAGHQVTVVDNLSTGRRENLDSKATLFTQDIQDPALERILQELHPEAVLHLAAQASVTHSMRDPAADASTNIMGTINLLRCCHATGVKKLVYVSTGGALYGEPSYLPCDEDHPIQPLSFYGLSKHTAERYTWLFAQETGLRCTTLRLANVYGPRQDPDGEAGVVAIFANHMLHGEQAIIFGDGEQTRDFVYVGDVVEACLLALERGDGQAYNIGTAMQTSVNTIFAQLARLTGYAAPATYRPARPGDVRHISLSARKAAAELGWQPRVDLATGLERTVVYFRQASALSDQRR